MQNRREQMETGNRLFANLEKGRVSIGSIVSMSDLVVSELAGDCGMDFAWIDAEHAPHTIQDVQRHLIALRGTAAVDFPRWKERGVDWFAGISDWGAMAAGVRAFKAECDKVREV